MSDQQFTIKDMIGLASQDNPNQFAVAFDQVIGPKISQAIDNKKIEIAKKYFNPAQEEPEAEVQEVEASSDSEEDKEEDNNTEASDGNKDTESATQEV